MNHVEFVVGMRMIVGAMHSACTYEEDLPPCSGKGRSGIGKSWGFEFPGDMSLSIAGILKQVVGAEGLVAYSYGT
jgi:hypothetical protein